MAGERDSGGEGWMAVCMWARMTRDIVKKTAMEREAESESESLNVPNVPKSEGGHEMGLRFKVTMFLAIINELCCNLDTINLHSTKER